MSEASALRIGLGTDLHRLEAGRPLWIGGVEIPSEAGAVGHSDGDVVLHALSDALLGALAEGDIGELFPDSDPRHRGLDSAVILAEARRRVSARGARVLNADVVVHLQSPRLLPWRDRIRGRIAELLEVDAARVFVKAKTGEELGAVGEGRAISAQAVVLLAGVDAVS